jgi:NTP pyrophosphatase (non-canonical NTP hydrolase)
MMRELESYNEFVKTLLSSPSSDVNVLIQRIQELHDQNLVNISMLMTASDGMVAEGGELKEIVKKILYQGKPLNEDNVFHMKRELGDVIFYWIVGCMALGENPYEVIEENIRKLKARYPGGEFSIMNSEIRKKDDL